MKVSILIPTHKHLEDCLKPCLTSVIKNTDLSTVEVIVIANGCGNDGTKEYIESLGEPFKLIWIQQAGRRHRSDAGLHGRSSHA